SGSAAAVAAGMVPFALGSQTQGSILRPASYCGVVGFKPTFGAISREGVLPFAPSLDTVGFFAETAADMLELQRGRQSCLLTAREDPCLAEKPPGKEAAGKIARPTFAAFSHPLIRDAVLRLRAAG